MSENNSMDPNKDKEPSQVDDSVEKRSRTLTEKGQELYESHRHEHFNKVDSAWKDVAMYIEDIGKCELNLQTLRTCEKDLRTSCDKLRSVFNNFVVFLNRTGTEQSTRDLNSVNEKFSSYTVEMESALCDISKRIDDAVENMSVRSVRSHKSSSRTSGLRLHCDTSESSSYVARKLAKAEAAKAAVDFASKEADLLKKKAVITEENQIAAAAANRKIAQIEADELILQQQKAAAEAAAEVKALQTTGLEDEVSNKLPLPEDDPKERTRAYVHDTMKTQQNLLNPKHVQGDSDEKTVIGVKSSQLNPNAEVYEPSRQALDISHFLLKKDLLFSRLYKFNDQPETYHIWKTGFLSVMTDMNVSHDEELDLLVKWLGQESGKHAMSIKTANAHNPQLAVERLWQRLDERYGAPEMVEASLKSRLAHFPKLTNKDNSKLYNLSDLVSEIEALKSCETYCMLLAYFDTSAGVIPIVQKLPHSLQEKWTNHASGYKEQHSVAFPPFSVFVNFLRKVSKVRNDPSFAHDTASSVPHTQDKPQSTSKQARPSVNSRKTEVAESKSSDNRTCPLHKTKHSLNDCKAFRMKSYEERKDFLRSNRICYKCCSSTEHIAKMCDQAKKCRECNSQSHATALHVDGYLAGNRGPTAPRDNGGEREQTFRKSEQTFRKDTQHDPVSIKCTQICGSGFSGKSCAKTVLVNVYPKGQPDLSVKMYALLDDQSNSTLARTEFFDAFGVKCEEIPYTLSSCSGVMETTGRKASGFIVEPIDGSTSHELPAVIECNSIPNQRDEIPTPEVARHYWHLTDIASFIPPLDDQSEILLLIGRDMIQAHHVYDHRIGPGNTPYAQKLPSGWVIIGESCIGKVHEKDIVNVSKTYLLPSGRPTAIFEPCPNLFSVKELSTPCLQQCENSIGQNVFRLSKDDDKPGLSIEDKQFLEIMEKEMCKGSDGNWIAPLPFKPTRPVLPNNRSQAMRRAQTLDRSIKQDPVKRHHVMDFMAKIIDNSHAEKAPPLKESEECWYLPLFGVYHPRKPGQIRMVFDSSAPYNGVSLNNVLLQGPDMMNSLLEILLKFRKHQVGVMGDIQQMFYCFQVREDHRNYLRFFWYEDNDSDKKLIEYRMKVHVFGNRSSPAIAAFGLHKTAEAAKDSFGEDVVDFIKRDFYVDDGLVSKPTASEAVDLVKRTQQGLKTFGNIRLHKIISNNHEVMKSFPNDDLAKDLQELNFDGDKLPLQRSLGMLWNIRTDTFTFKWSGEQKPYTKRGVLSTINSVYDPMGLVAPVIIQGKVLLRELINQKVDWDDPLPSEYQEEWEIWRDSLKALEQLNIPRPYLQQNFEESEKHIQVYADASGKAISAVAYLVGQNKQNSEIGFLLGKSKVAPTHGHTIPRLELCASVLAIEIGSIVCESLEVPSSSVQYFTDSRIVLGYISNETRRFSVYIANRVATIRKFSSPQQWNYVETGANPADCGTRFMPASIIGDSKWLNGPSQLPGKPDISETVINHDIERDFEFQCEVKSCVTQIDQSQPKLDTQRFERFSDWKRLVCTIARLQSFARDRKHHISPSNIVSAEAFIKAENFIIRQVQYEYFGEDIQCIQSKKPLSKDSPLHSLNPFIDEDRMLRIGGRLSKAELEVGVKNPLIIPGRHHIALLLVRMYHEKMNHQGRLFTEGAVRAAGLWITGGKRLINSVIFKCVNIRKLRGQGCEQKMADLPKNRLTPSPPFTFVGVDTFGPWSVTTRRTRGGQANSKRWALLFTCLVIRAIHIEVIDELSTSAFINALRRFISIRGNVKEFRSDRGTNFIGASGVLNVNVIYVEDEPVQRFLSDKKASWIFNAPHASHMGGVWERMIGVVRKILDSMLLSVSHRNLTHDVLTTLMAEICAMVNARPIVPVSSDPEVPGILSPSSLLTLKSDHVENLVTNCDMADLYRSQWKLVQALAEQFWSRWKTDYLYTLQGRRKWFDSKRNIAQDDVVLLKEKNTVRNEWPIGLVEKAILSEDGKTRKAVVRVIRENSVVKLTRPITELVLLLTVSATDE